MPNDGEVRDWLAAVLARVADAPAGNCDIAVRIVDADESRELNRRYRHRDAPTNVLSFPASNELPLSGDEPRPLGDLVLCAPLVAEEAREQGKPAAAHWAHLLVHGALHLLGYDHQDAQSARRMEALEIEILAARGLPDPYHERETP